MRGWTDEKIRQLKAKGIREVGTSVRRSKPKQGGPVALVQTPEISKLNPPCMLVVTCYKTGAGWDTGNIEYKSVLDSLVKNGVIPDDRQTEVPKIITEGVRVGSEEEERTIIEVFEN